MENVSLAISRLARMVNRYGDRKLKPHNLTVQQFILLKTLYRAPLAVHILAAEIGVDRTTICRNTQPLLKRGLVGFMPGIDRRVRMVNLLPEGRKAVEDALPTWQLIDETIIEFIESQNIEGVVAALVILSTFSEQ